MVRNKANIYLAVAGGLLLGSFMLMYNSEWIGSKELHTHMEVAATLLAGIVGIISWLRYLTNRELRFLFIAAGFLSTALLDGYHAIVTSVELGALMVSLPESLIPWSWSASRLSLSVLMFVSWYFWHKEGETPSINKLVSIYRIVALWVIGVFVFFVFAPLPRAYYPELIFGRPQEFLPGLFFLIAFWGHVSKGAWKKDGFEFGLVIFLLISVFSQVVYMPLSFGLFDAMFDGAHLLKILSYISILIGILISLNTIFHESKQSSDELIELNNSLAEEIAFRKSVAEKLEVATLSARQMAEEARAASLAKSNFLSTMSHEIRTPLNGIIGMASLLVESELGEEDRESAEIIFSSAESLLTIVNQVLDLSKIEAGKVELEMVPFDLDSLFNDVKGLFICQAKEKGIDFYCSIDSDPTNRYIGDPARIRQVIVNMVHNALKFTREGSIGVVGYADHTSEDETIIHFFVTDTGIGISMEAQARIFDSFTQADSSTTRMYGGTGLGLTICSTLVNLMGGEIDVQSEPGQGAEFHFFVKVARVDEEILELVS